MRLREWETPWPPIVTIGKGNICGQVKMPPPACLDDAVTDARSVGPRTIVLDLLNREREEYRITVHIDQSLHRRVLIQTAMQSRTTLREVGELLIS